MVQVQETHQPPLSVVLEAYISVTGSTYAARPGDRLIGVNRAGTVTVTFPTAQLRLLHHELLAAIPGLNSVPSLTGELLNDPVMIVEGLSGSTPGCSVRITVPEGADEHSTQAVVEAHDHAILQPNAHKQRLDRINETDAEPRSQWTSARCGN